MKKLLVIVLAALPFVAFAQMPGMPGGMQMPGMQDLPEETIVAETQSMVAQYALNEDQAAKLLDLNKKYLGKVSYPVILPPEAEEAMKNAAANRPAGGAGGFNFFVGDQLVCDTHLHLGGVSAAGAGAVYIGIPAVF